MSDKTGGGRHRYGVVAHLAPPSARGLPRDQTRSKTALGQACCGGRDEIRSERGIVYAFVFLRRSVSFPPTQKARALSRQLFPPSIVERREVDVCNFIDDMIDFEHVLLQL